MALDGDRSQAETAIGALAVGKGLATRWTRQRSTLLASLSGWSASKARRELADLQAKVASLPTAGNEGIVAWAQWSNAVHHALQPVMKDLAAAGRRTSSRRRRPWSQPPAGR
ncbi:MAG: hypothetical protein MZW92_57340 [Comamonadaceae bacterium]|nr:hypothetical protein [Comamonadaceae bacterium]